MDDNRKKALAAALGQIEKQFGKGSVMRLGDGTAAKNVEAVSTGSMGLMSRWASAVCRKGELSKSTALSHPVKQR